jgi:hypothetical protein
LVVDVGLARWRDETRKAATTGRQRKTPPLSLLALLMLLLVGLGGLGTAKAEEPAGRVWSSRSYPTVRWFTRNGLDRYNNKFEAVISIGVPCPEYRRIWPGDCPTEFFLTRFLESLPPDLIVIESTLRSFGAVCRKLGQRLTCIYKKDETYKQQLTDNRITEEVYHYTAKLNIAKRDDKLVYSTSFDRKVTKLHENEPPKREARVLGRFQPEAHAVHRKKHRLSGNR